MSRVEKYSVEAIANVSPLLNAFRQAKMASQDTTQAITSTWTQLDFAKIFGGQMKRVSVIANGVERQLKSLARQIAEIAGPKNSLQFWREYAHVLGATDAEINQLAPSFERLAKAEELAAQKLGSAYGRQYAGLTGHQRSVARFNSANIAAQLQDIAVTAQFMDPMKIALQQATQLSAVFTSQADGLRGALKSLAGAFKMVLGPVSMVTMVLVALVAAGLQAVHWMELFAKIMRAIRVAAAAVLSFLAEHVEELTLAVAALTVVLIRLNAVAIVSAIQGFAALAKAAAAATSSMVAALVAAAIANPFVAIVIGVTAAVAALIVFSDTLRGGLVKSLKYLTQGIEVALLVALKLAVGTLLTVGKAVMFVADSIWTLSNAIIELGRFMFTGVYNTTFWENYVERIKELWSMPVYGDLGSTWSEVAAANAELRMSFMYLAGTVDAYGNAITKMNREQKKYFEGLEKTNKSLELQKKFLEKYVMLYGDLARDIAPAAAEAAEKMGEMTGVNFQKSLAQLVLEARTKAEIKKLMDKPLEYEVEQEQLKRVIAEREKFVLAVRLESAAVAAGRAFAPGEDMTKWVDQLARAVSRLKEEYDDDDKLEAGIRRYIKYLLDERDAVNFVTRALQRKGEAGTALLKQHKQETQELIATFRDLAGSMQKLDLVSSLPEIKKEFDAIDQATRDLAGPNEKGPNPFFALAAQKKKDYIAALVAAKEAEKELARTTSVEGTKALKEQADHVADLTRQLNILQDKIDGVSIAKLLPASYLASNLGEISEKFAALKKEFSGTALLEAQQKLVKSLVSGYRVAQKVKALGDQAESQHVDSARFTAERMLDTYRALVGEIDKLTLVAKLKGIQDAFDKIQQRAHSLHGAEGQDVVNAEADKERAAYISALIRQKEAEEELATALNTKGTTAVKNQVAVAETLTRQLQILRDGIWGMSFDGLFSDEFLLDNLDRILGAYDQIRQQFPGGNAESIAERLRAERLLFDNLLAEYQASKKMDFAKEGRFPGKIEQETELLKEQLAVLKNLGSYSANHQVQLYIRTNIGEVSQQLRDIRSRYEGMPELISASTKTYLQSIGALVKAQRDELWSVNRNTLDVERQYHDSLIGGLDDIVTRTVDVGRGIADVISNMFSRTEDALVDFVKTGKLELADLFDAIITDLVRLTIRITIMIPLVTAFKALMGGAGVPLISMFAKGGVVESPVAFTHRGGVGVAGEAGAEAILPLRRINGILGVMAHGGAAGKAQEVIVNMNNTGAPKKASVSDIERTNKAAVIQIMMSDWIHGGPFFQTVRGGR